MNFSQTFDKLAQAVLDMSLDLGNNAVWGPTIHSKPERVKNNEGEEEKEGGAHPKPTRLRQ